MILPAAVRYLGELGAAPARHVASRRSATACPASSTRSSTRSPRSRRPSTEAHEAGDVQAGGPRRSSTRSSPRRQRFGPSPTSSRRSSRDDLWPLPKYRELLFQYWRHGHGCALRSGVRRGADRVGARPRGSGSSSSSSPTSSASSRRSRSRSTSWRARSGTARGSTARPIEGFTRIAESDQYLMPDMRTFSEIPWSERARAARASSATSSRPAASRSPATRAASSGARSSARRSSATSSTWARSSSSSSSAARMTATIEPLPHDQAGYFDFSTDLAHDDPPGHGRRPRGVRDPRRGGPPRGRGRPARDRLRVRRRAPDRRQRDHLQVHAQGDRPAARPVRDVHAQADPRHQRLGDAHPPEPVLDRRQAERVRRRRVVVRPVAARASRTWPASSPTPGA